MCFRDCDFNAGLFGADVAPLGHVFLLEPQVTYCPLKGVGAGEACLLANSRVSHVT